MKAFHVSNEDYHIGETVSIAENQESHYYTNGTVDQKLTTDYIDAFIDKKYPDLIHRKSALFAFERLEHAIKYCKSERAHFIYEVDFKISYKGPMVLVNTLMKNLDNPSKCEAIANEYFTPNLSIDGDRRWLMYELIGSEFKVERVIDVRGLSSFDYFTDYDKSERLFGSKGKKGKIA